MAVINDEQGPGGLEAAIRQIAQDVYNQLGPGHLETIYHAAMEVGCRLRGIEYETKKVIEVRYEGYCIGREEADLVVSAGEDQMVLELKAAATLAPGDTQQLKNYMMSLDVMRGLLINFPSPSKIATEPTEPTFEPVPARSLAPGDLLRTGE